MHWKTAKIPRLDLHNCDAEESLDQFLAWYHGLLKSGARQGELVHGYGSTGKGGLLCFAFDHFLDILARAGTLQYLSGDMYGNCGAKQVRPRSSISENQRARWPECVEWAFLELTGRERPIQAMIRQPPAHVDFDLIERAILRYCSSPRRWRKVVARCGRLGRVEEAVRGLLRKGHLRKVFEHGDELLLNAQRENEVTREGGNGD